MTKLSKYHDLVSKLDEDKVVAIVGLIDLKTEDDMDKVLNKLDTIESKIDARLDSLESKLDAKISSLKSSVNMIRWWIVSVAGIAIGLSTYFVRLILTTLS